MSFNHPSGPLPYNVKGLNAPGHVYSFQFRCEYCDFTQNEDHSGPDGLAKEWMRTRYCPNCIRLGIKSMLVKSLK